MEHRGILLSALPLATAIGLFGVIYGAAATPLFDAAPTLASSVLIFSGAVQFTVASLAAEGAGPVAVVAAAALVNTRNLVLGGVLRPHLRLSPLQRALCAWFLIDEVVGLALLERRQATRILLSAGALAYGAWLTGTALGAAGGEVVPGLARIAGALFPVLFIGLAALAADSPSPATRALTAAGLTAVLALTWPSGRALAPVAAAVLTALPARRRPLTADRRNQQ